jgi:pimeloyl-ACP methyl ester carboxylesterase
LAACGDSDEQTSSGAAAADPEPSTAGETGGDAGSAEAQEVEFETSDGVLVKGTLTPAGGAGGPAVILVHQFGSNRSDWDELAPLLNERGYSTLAYDIRGMGESTELAGGGAVDASAGADYLDAFPLDTQAAAEVLRSELEPSAIGVVGASVGANTAFVASGSGFGLDGAVALSAATDGPLRGLTVDGFEPSGVLFIADSAEIGDSQTLAAETGDPQELIEAEIPGHGVALLASMAVVASIVDWLDERLS